MRCLIAFIDWCPRHCASLLPRHLQVVRWLVTSSGDCDGDRATAVRLGQDLVSHRLLTPVCAGYDRPEDLAGSSGGGGRSSTAGGDDVENEKDHADLFGSFDDAAGWLFAFEGDALRNPFAPPPPIHVAIMANTGVEVAVTGWVEVRLSVSTSIYEATFSCRVLCSKS